MMQADLQTLFSNLAKASANQGAHPEVHPEPAPGLVQPTHGVEIPSAYKDFLRLLGPGSWGEFLHFHALEHMSTHEELLSSFMDDDLQELLEPTADVLVFASSDNGDMCGWHLHDLIRMPSDDCPVIRIAPRSFDGVVIAATTAELFQLLGLGANLFGVGALPRMFRPRSQQ